MNRLLATFSSVEANSCVPVQPLIEPLSDRELEVLQNLATDDVKSGDRTLQISRPVGCVSASVTHPTKFVVTCRAMTLHCMPNRPSKETLTKTADDEIR